MQNSTYTSEVWQFLTKLNVLLPYDSASTLFGICPGELKTGPHENQHIDVVGSLINNCQNLEATKISISRLMDKKTVVYPTREHFSLPKRNELSSHEKTWRKLIWIFKAVKTIPQDTIIGSFVKPIGCTSRVNLSVIYRLLVIMMSQWRFTDCNKSIILV